MKKTLWFTLVAALLLSVSAEATDIGARFARIIVATDTIAHAETVTSDTSGRIYLPGSGRYWLAIDVDVDTNFATGNQGDTLKVILQHSLDGWRWQLYDSTVKLNVGLDTQYTLAAAHMASSRVSLNVDSLNTWPWMRAVFRVTDSVIATPAMIGNRYNYNLKLYLSPVKL